MVLRVSLTHSTCERSFLACLEPNVDEGDGGAGEVLPFDAAFGGEVLTRTAGPRGIDSFSSSCSFTEKSWGAPHFHEQKLLLR